MIALKHMALCGLHDSPEFPSKWTDAFSYWDPKEIPAIKHILQEGIINFKKIYGYGATCFTPPAQQFPESLESFLPKLGIKAMDKPLYSSKHIGFGKHRRRFHYIKQNRDTGLLELVRNVVFEPTDSNIDHVDKAIKQVEAAFRWNRPAIISSHRVNFSGGIDPKNRKKGLDNLNLL